MASFKYYIRTQNSDKIKEHQIRIRFSQGNQFDCHAKTLLHIALKNWNEKKGEVKSNSAFKGKNELVNKLKNLKLHIELAENNEPDKRKISTAWLNQQISQFYEIENSNDEKEGQLLYQFDKYINEYKTKTNIHTGKKISKETIKKQRTCFNYLKEFEEKNRRILNLSDMNSLFVEQFIHYLNHRERKIKPKKYEKYIEKGMSVNTIAKQLAVLKTFLLYANEKGLTTLSIGELKKFKYAEEKSDAIYLDVDELEKVNNLDLSDNSTLEHVRDYFIISAWTGLRFSDFIYLNKNNIAKDNLLRIRQSKTTHDVTIPLHKNVISILKKYDYNLPAVISNQKMNDYLKIIGQKAELNDPFVKKITIGGETKEIILQKWEVLSTHTGRRSFATNHYKLGLDSLAIMAITGHRTEQSFLKYIKVTKEEQAKRIIEFWKKVNL